MSSPFLAIDPAEWILSNELAFAIFDKFPVSAGHALVITKRLVPTWFEANPSEQAAVMDLVNRLKSHLDQTLRPTPAGYNVGFNAGTAAGQTVPHLHLHVIPRYEGDVPDPRGGVRFVIPDKANYLLPQRTNPARLDSQNPPPATTSIELNTGFPKTNLWNILSNRLYGARVVDILASFVQSSGLDLIESQLFATAQEPSRLRILVSDYLHISDPNALRRLLHWEEAIQSDPEMQGKLEVRLVELDRLSPRPASFHPKAWRIVDELGSFVAVGSSNLSRPALETGVEWNLLVSSVEQSGLPQDFAREFDLLWESSSQMTLDLIDRYAAAASQLRRTQVDLEALEAFEQPEIPEPRPWQQVALASLKRVRDNGYRRALVSVATGMGKTWLAAFDVCQFGAQLGRLPTVLIIAHRTHILAQAESALLRILRANFGEVQSSWLIGGTTDRSRRHQEAEIPEPHASHALTANLILASIQKLSRPESLEALAKRTFDYVVIDEVHHAAAPTYRRVLSQLNATFVLGLTATPERADGVDVASIFDDNLAHHASIGDGIAEESLVPFHYIGIRDTVKFDQIPWRNGRFDPEELERRVAVSERMERLRKTLESHPAERTIFFCCSRRHALFARDWLRSRGVKVAAIFSGEGSDRCGESLDQLRAGELDAICVVDMFNEGLDIPAVDRVVMLRPTESKVIFLQQLGRGLRASVGKTRLLVIDFVGNHRIFAFRILHLLALGRAQANLKTLRDFLEGDRPELPAGCLLDIEVSAIDMLKNFLPQGSEAALEAYRALRDELGRRPTPAELVSRSYLPSTLSKSAGSWFEFVEAEGDLSDSEHEVLSTWLDWLKTLETTKLNKSYKMILLRALLDRGKLFAEVDLADLSRWCRELLRNHPILSRDLEEGSNAIDHKSASDESWSAWWIEWPVSRWLAEQNGEKWFSCEGNLFRLTRECPVERREALESMTSELVDWRLAAYARSHGLDRVDPSLNETLKSPATSTTAPNLDGSIASFPAPLQFEAKVSHANGRPILFLPEVTSIPYRPVGPTLVSLPDGSEWEFKFVKVACNVAKPVGSTENQLSTLLHLWFGPDAGRPGTDYRVRFVREGNQWTVNLCG